MISGDRNVFVSAHVKQEVKDALRATAQDFGISMSLYISLAIEEKLERDGVVIPEPNKDHEPELPFDADNHEASH